MRNLRQNSGRKTFTASLVSLVAIQAFSSLAMAGSTNQISNYYQDWKLDPTENAGSGCAQTLTGYQGDDVPGTQGMPHVPSTSLSVRFVADGGDAPEIFTLGSGPTTQSDHGTVTVSIANNTLSILDQSAGGLLFWKSKTLRKLSYAILPNGALVVSTQIGKQAASTCSYLNAHPEKVGMVEVGAVLINNGAKVAECNFVPATPRPDQANFVYNEKCTFGKFTVKETIGEYSQVLSTELAANDQAPHDLEIVRASSALNTEGENYLSRDTEIAVQDSSVDNITPSNDEYFLSPYRTSTYAIDGTQATIQIQYAPAAQN